MSEEMKKLLGRAAAGLLTLTLAAGLPGLCVHAEIIDQGEMEELTWTLDDAGTMTVSGSGAICRSFVNSDTRVKKFVTAPGSAISEIEDNAFCAYMSDSPLYEVEINTTVPLKIGHKVFIYQGTGPVSYTIHAPEISMDREIYYDYNYYPVHFNFNVGKGITFRTSTFDIDYRNSDSTFIIPTGSTLFVPAQYSFTDPVMQVQFNYYAEIDQEQVFWEDFGSELTEGEDYGKNSDAYEELLTPENQSLVFGEAQVIFKMHYTKVEAKASTATVQGNREYYIGSDGKYYELNTDGTYTEVAEDSWLLPLAEPTVLEENRYCQTAHKEDNYYTRYVYVTPEEQIEGKQKAVFDVTYNDKTYTYKTDTYYTGMISNDVEYKPEKGCVLLVVTVVSKADISAEMDCSMTLE